MAEKIESGTVSISIRLDKNVKKDAEILFSELGMNMTTAFNIFLRRCLMEKKIPFEVGIRGSNTEIKATFEETETVKNAEKQKLPPFDMDFVISKMKEVGYRNSEGLLILPKYYDE